LHDNVLVLFPLDIQRRSTNLRLCRHSNGNTEWGKDQLFSHWSERKNYHRRLL